MIPYNGLFTNIKKRLTTDVDQTVERFKQNFCHTEVCFYPSRLTVKLMSLTWTSSDDHLPKSLISGNSTAGAGSSQFSVIVPTKNVNSVMFIPKPILF